MQYAVTRDGEKIEAVKDVEAFCPICLEPVLARCGRIKIHHWAHVADLDCDSWTEPETEWHRAWKTIFDPCFVEVPMGPHRADIQNESGLVVELQNSSISPAEILERERFYGNMVWVVNAELFADRLFLMKRMAPQIFAFKWKHMRPSWRYARKPVFLDLGRFSVKDLLGVEVKGPSAFAYGVQKNLSRYDGTNGSHINHTLVGIPEEVRNHSVLRINTIYESGRGSVEVLDMSELRTRLGAN
ncbi:MAG: hypothetical protein GC165_08330 [Armatimonadetes bacterium]|nr:hypothetical protein [Armatimonadota bacterium]